MTEEQKQQHPCDNIGYDEEFKEWYLEVESEYKVTIIYCPYCGTKL